MQNNEQGRSQPSKFACSIFCGSATGRLSSRTGGFNYRRSRWNLNAHCVGISSYHKPLFSPRFFRRVLFVFEGNNRVDGGISYTLPIRDQTSIELYVRGENLLDDTYFEDGFRTPGATAWGGIRYRFR